MLDANIKAQLRAYLEKIQHPIELVSSLDGSARAQEMLALLQDIAALSDKVSVRQGWQCRAQAFICRRPPWRTGTYQLCRHPDGARIHLADPCPAANRWPSPKVEASVIEEIRAIPGQFHFETFISLSCHNCPDVVQALNLMAVQNPGISHQMIDGALFQDEVTARQIMGVPTVFLNGEPFGQGRMTLEEIIGKIDTGALQREAEKVSARAPFDVLIVGGGPAGAAAAIYAARKGIRTGVVSERFGGQVLDTLAIENFISVKETDGPRLAAGLEEACPGVRRRHHQSAARRGAAAGNRRRPAEVRLASGAKLRSKAVIIATGARWREMNVPGEKEYRGHGVAYCPHCDGPLFKGKRVAVIGGGNSGVEAAIDLAGVVGHVTLLEFERPACRRHPAEEALQPGQREGDHPGPEHRGDR
jgi:alkyl hydroperoxide reductase subunit F